LQERFEVAEEPDNVGHLQALRSTPQVGAFEAAHLRLSVKTVPDPFRVGDGGANRIVLVLNTIQLLNVAVAHATRRSLFPRSTNVSCSHGWGQSIPDTFVDLGKRLLRVA